MQFFRKHLTIPLFLLGMLWGIHLLNYSVGYSLSRYGLIPRQLDHLYGIVSSPFLHANFTHIISNSIPLFILSLVCLAKGRTYFIANSLFIIIVGGSGVWLFARSANHIGASGWIFGLWGLCVASAWFQRNLSSLVIATLVIGLYGGMIWGVLPTQPGVSFEGHMFGLLAGVLAARISRTSKVKA
ncbi:MAG: rhomboid family intramembrane serine protease [Pseudomonadales bacterium]|nr:rhomboid family intramembrane serine protease [Pseudomonadales bacterium]